MNIDKILNKIIDLLLVIILFLSIIILSFFVFPSSHAVDNFDNQPLPVQQYIYSPTDNVALLFGTNSDNYNGYVTNKMGNVDMYAFIWKYNDSQSCLTVCYDNSYNGSNQEFMYLGIGSASATSKYCNTLESTYNLKYNVNILINSTGVTWYIPYFDTQAEGFQAVRNKIDGIVEPEISLYEGLNIPPGYIARIQVKNGSKFTMLTTMGTDNIAYQDKWVYTSQWYKFNDTSNPETAMATDGITIPWARFGNTNILGQTNKAQYTINSTVASYVWVLNPAYMVGQNADLYDTKLNNAIQLTNVTDILQVRIFALKSTYTWGGIVSSTSTGSGIEYDTDNGSWVNDNGDTVNPVDYGDTNVPTTGTTLIQQFETLLSNLINRIERLLVAPVDYINQLIQSANQFFLWLRGLWSWLPGPVVESISAVLIIMCTVGALKLLWR